LFNIEKCFNQLIMFKGEGSSGFEIKKVPYMRGILIIIEMVKIGKRDRGKWFYLCLLILHI